MFIRQETRPWDSKTSTGLQHPHEEATGHGLQQAPTVSLQCRGPRPIPMDTLFSLDVDNKIWQDVGLTDEWDHGDLPPWLADDKVRAGIRGLLCYDRGREEIARLMQERDAMQDWFAEEWSVLIEAIATT
ncbi:hypothetical protein V5O48_015695, partial [Marasmius crinis-equi]